MSLPTPSSLPRSGSVLHVGCGRDALPAWLSGYDETRLDIDPDCEPDIVASMTDMGDIGAFDVVVSCHALEHLYPHEVPVALREFLRVLNPGGYAAIFVPDLEDAPATDEPLFTSAAGPIAGLDLIYGLRRALAEHPHMAHHTGFTRATLAEAMREAGFSPVVVNRLDCFNLMGAGAKP